MLFGLKVMGSILNFLDDLDSLEYSEQRMLLNAKQQIILFEQAALAVKVGAEDECCKIVEMIAQSSAVLTPQRKGDAMKLSNTSMLKAGDIRALLREFNCEAQNILAHLESLERACEEEIAARATH